MEAKPMQDRRRAIPTTNPATRRARGSGAATVAIAGLLGAAWAGAALQGGARYDRTTGVSPKAAVTAEAAAPAGPTWDLPNLDHERVDYWVGRFTTDKRDEFSRFLARSGRYVPMISEKLAERDMPQDLIYLAMIESGFNPEAYSPAKASGLWQFIAETGQRYGLKIDAHVDERNDPVRSTDAALDYLTYLHDRLGSWYLAAAGYNTGENRVARIMREETGSEKGDEYSYYKIWDRLPRETRDYVPLMIAAARISKEPAKYGFGDVELEAPLAYDEVPVDAGTPLAAVAEAVGATAKEIARLNPQFKRASTPAKGRALVRIPEGTRTAFLVNWPEVREKRTLAATEYRVRRGESLLAIAKQHGVSVNAIRAENQLRGDRILAGETLRIPAR
jgi:membrane-bound lytic murein transglycosylase D